MRGMTGRARSIHMPPLNIGASIYSKTCLYYSYIFLGVPYYIYSMKDRKTLFQLLRPLYFNVWLFRGSRRGPKLAKKQQTKGQDMARHSLQMLFCTEEMRVLLAPSYLCKAIRKVMRQASEPCLAPQRQPVDRISVADSTQVLFSCWPELRFRA